MKLTLVRHGEIAGDPFICPESPVTGCLSPHGIAQAQATAEALKNEKFDIAYSSPFGRALQTAEITLAGRELDIQIMPFIHEWLPKEEYRRLPDEEWEELMRSQVDSYAEQSWASEIGEGFLDMYVRIVPAFLSEMAKIGIHPMHGGFVPDEKAKDLSVIIFAHGGSLGVLTSFLLGVRIFPISGFNYAHTGVARFGFSCKKGVYYPHLILPALHGLEA
ncbi:MAG: phosphoglycerate mutase family protein [Defluviitaleaceae bacterium]|nr:phosphoglycerate mutase family protein [Defluviitaleaceae bacterium]